MIDPVAVASRLSQTVDPQSGRVPAFIFTDPEVYRLELTRVFNRSWLFVAHDSELASPGDFVTREMGEQPVIVVRGEDGAVRVFLNFCRHRGMKLARHCAGNTSHFRCPYHGFTYRISGELTGVPFERDAYEGRLDKSSLSLIEARVATYRGMIFATWNPEAEPLEDYLGAVAWYLDILIGRARMEVVGPPQVWTIPTGWKLPAENFVSDAYHTAYTHASIARLNLIPNPDFGKTGYHVNAGNGHGLGLGIQDEGLYYPQELRAEFERNLSPDQLTFLDRLKNLHGTVFPNLSFLIPTAVNLGGEKIWNTTVRLWQPRGPERIQVYSWCLVESGAPDWWKELTRQAYIQTFGTSGMFEQDDTENWESQTANSHDTLGHDADLLFNYEMGIDRTPLTDFVGPGTVYDGKFSEANARAFYGHWLELMTRPAPGDGMARARVRGAEAV